VGAAISIEAADDRGSAATLHGSFDQRNEWFLDKHLRELSGDVVLDCRHLERLDDNAASCLRRFCAEAAAQRRRVVLRALAPRFWQSIRAA
jgi:anti-anti-sigma regulatory factor